MMFNFFDRKRGNIRNVEEDVVRWVLREGKSEAIYRRNIENDGWLAIRLSNGAAKNGGRGVVDY